MGHHKRNDLEPKIDIKYLETPIKSDHDSKEYRVIKLRNGLTALLISDLYENELKLLKTKNKLNQKMSCDENNIERHRKLSCQRSLSLDEAPIIAKPKENIKPEKLAACSLSVNVGSFSDPIEIQGLSHFLEHMCFIGSEKYPKVNEFQSMLQLYGGSTNAYTSVDETVYYFGIPELHLVEALDRFAQFFISPLLQVEAISKERLVVESEFQLHSTNDYYKKYQILTTCMQDGHPSKTFIIGNKETLEEKINADDLYIAAKKYHLRHYSGNRMTLAIQARLPLDTLEAYVKKYFTDVPCNHLPPDDFDNFKGPETFVNSKFHKLFRFKPIGKSCYLELMWSLKPYRNMYESKPHRIVAWIMNHEGKGSLTSYLRKKSWIINLRAGIAEGFFYDTDLYSVFSIEVQLTDEGYKHIDGICEVIFEYIKMMQEMTEDNERTLKRIYDEYVKIEDASFKYLVETSPLSNVIDLSAKMHLLQSEYLLTGQCLVWKYDPEEMHNIVNCLVPDKVNLTIQDVKLPEDQFDKEEYWFKTKYRVDDIPEEWIEKWKNVEMNPEFYFPEPNVYIANEFSLIPICEAVPEYPIKVYKDHLLQVYHKLDPKFRNPETYITIHVKTPLLYMSPSHSVMTDLYNIILEKSYVEEVYPASIAGLSNSVYTSSRALKIQLSGWSQKLPLLLTTILEKIVNFQNTVTPELFNAGKEEQLLNYEDLFTSESSISIDVTNSITVLQNWTNVDQYEALMNVDFEQFQYFIKHLFDNAQLAIIAQGNISKEDVINLGICCSNILKCKPLPLDTWPWTRIMKYPLGEHCCRVKHLDPENVNSQIDNIYQAEDTSIKVKALIDILTTMMMEPLFTELRTEQQLGYSVDCSGNDNNGINEFVISVITQANNFRTDEVDRRIEEFVKKFKKVLANTTLEKFEQFKNTCIKTLEIADSNLLEEFYRNQVEVDRDRFAFDKLELNKAALRSVTLEELIEWYEDHTLGGKKFRKISIQVVGNDKKEDGKKIDKKIDEKNYHTQYLSDYNDEKPPKPEGYFITNSARFKNDLSAFPIKHTSYK